MICLHLLQSFLTVRICHLVLISWWFLCYRKKNYVQILGDSWSYLTHCSTLSMLACSNPRASKPTQTRSIEVSPERTVFKKVEPEPSCRRIGRELDLLGQLCLSGGLACVTTYLLKISKSGFRLRPMPSRRRQEITTFTKSPSNRT